MLNSQSSMVWTREANIFPKSGSLPKPGRSVCATRARTAGPYERMAESCNSQINP
jgi:hypothetical protein